MRHIDIDSLSEDELIELNHKVVARLRFLSQMRSHSAMLDFRVGERVKFQPDGSPELLGTLTRYNKKTVTVVTDAGQHWNVSPSLLARANPPAQQPPTQTVPASRASQTAPLSTSHSRTGSRTQQTGHTQGPQCE
jgi:hypothetical protein